MHDFAYVDCESASQAVLRALRQRLGYGLWMVTRTLKDDWIVLYAEDSCYGVPSGSVMRWSDSMCSRMVLGQGPNFAPHADHIEVYRTAPVAQQLPIKAYIGLPLTDVSGQLFGTLCAIDPQPQQPLSPQDESLVQLLAGLLNTLLRLELQASESARAAELAQMEALTDPMTQLFNRRGWEQLLRAEQARCHRYGHSAAVLAIDLDGLKDINDRLGHRAGDELILRAADALRQAARVSDVVARLGGDEFAILSVESDAQDADALIRRLQRTLEDKQVLASIGVSVKTPQLSLQSCCELADQQMYDNKRWRRQQLYAVLERTGPAL